MSTFGNLPIMPKEIRPSDMIHTTRAAPYPPSAQQAPRSAAIWIATDDEKLLQARASGLNWQPIAKKYFPNKTANACRKRHERLVERRQVEDWDVQKLEMLAQEYMAVRKEMWEILGQRLGERWSVVEAKCMEKGLKNLQGAARTSHRRTASTGPGGSVDEQGIPTDRHSDSGIVMCSDAEMEVDPSETARSLRTGSSSWHAHANIQPPPPPYHEHVRSQSLPHQLPLYQPPPPPPPGLSTEHRRVFDGSMTTSPATIQYARNSQRYSPESQNGRGGVSIQSMLSPAEAQRS